MTTLGTRWSDPKHCIHCGKVCRTKSGICRACNNGERLPDFKLLTIEQLVHLRDGSAGELVRRREAIETALKGAA